MRTEPDRTEKAEAEISSWAEDFRSAPPGEPTWSAEAIAAQASRDTRRDRLPWASRVAGTLFAVAVFLGIVVYTKSLAQAVLSAVVYGDLALP